MYWIFKIDEDTPVAPKADYIFEYSFESRSNFSGKINDYVIILVKENREWTFKYSSRIIEKPIKTILDKIDIADPDTFVRARQKITIKLSKFLLIEGINKLTDFSYSLRRIKKYSNPIVHFRKYSKISEFEYLNIFHGEVFISRTAFGYLFNSLHVEHRRQFIAMIISENLDLYFKTKDYIDGIKLLIEYIKNYIIYYAEILKESFFTLKDLIPDAKILQSISFTEETGVSRIENNIQMQINVYNEFLLNDEENFLEDLLIEIESSKQIEAKYSEFFKNTLWPMVI